MAINDIGDNTRRYMKLRGVSIAELSKHTGMGTAAISNLLNGKAEPKSSTLIKISEALDVSPSDLLADAPRLHSIRFRTHVLSGREKASRDQIRHETGLWLSNYRFLEDELHERLEYKLVDIHESDPVKAAMDVRESLELNQIEPIYDISGLMKEAGIKVQIRPFGFKKTFGLSVGKDDGGPAIIVNSEQGISVERQIFTVAHELGHLVLHQKSYDASHEEENSDEEREANSFAGEFLVPTEGFRREWDKAQGLDWVDAVLHIKKIFKVSYLTILMRLTQMKPELNCADIRREFSIRYNKMYGHDLKDYYEPDPLLEPVAKNEADTLSMHDFREERFRRLIRQAYEKGIISIGRAAEMIGFSIEQMRELMKDWQEIA